MSERVIPEDLRDMYVYASMPEPKNNWAEQCVKLIERLADLQAKLEEKDRIIAALERPVTPIEWSSHCPRSVGGHVLPGNGIAVANAVIITSPLPREHRKGITAMATEVDNEWANEEAEDRGYLYATMLPKVVKGRNLFQRAAKHIEDLESRLSALQQSHERELTALKLAATEQATHVKAVLEERTRERDALALSQGRLLEALRGLVALDHDSDDCAGVNDDCEVCEAMKAARAAIAEATPQEEKNG